MVHTPGKQGVVAARGITRLQKLQFVFEQKPAAASSRFYALVN
jgi:hypothetical protein